MKFARVLVFYGEIPLRIRRVDHHVAISRSISVKHRPGSALKRLVVIKTLHRRITRLFH